MRGSFDPLYTRGLQGLQIFFLLGIGKDGRALDVLGEGERESELEQADKASLGSRPWVIFVPSTAQFVGNYLFSNNRIYPLLIHLSVGTCVATVLRTFPKTCPPH